MKYLENEEKDQDRTDFSGLFEPNRRVYEYIATKVGNKNVLEAGCGNGVGSCLLAERANFVCATDKLQKNVDYAETLCSRTNINFDVWDIGGKAWPVKYETVVAVEVIEHVKKYREAVKNLIQSATHELWISTPNRNGIDDKWHPTQEFHVKEFAPEEVIAMIADALEVNLSIHKEANWLLERLEILHPETFERLDFKKGKINIHPLVYHLEL